MATQNVSPSTRNSFRIFKNCITWLRCFFQNIVIDLKYSNFMLKLRLFSSKRKYRRVLCRNFILHFYVFFLESRNFFLQRWYGFRFFFRHGVIRPRDNDDI